MCLLKVKEERDDYAPRVRRVKRVSTYSTPPRSSYYTNTRVAEERQPSDYGPPPPLSPPPVEETYHRESHTEIRQSEYPPSPPSVHTTTKTHTSRAPSQTRTHYVEVNHESESEDDSATSIGDDIRSRTTHKTSKTSNTHRSSRSRTTAPTTAPSEYSIHEREKEIRRERGYSNSRPRPEYETYQYVNAPGSGQSRRYDDPRASMGSYGRRSQQYYR
jgi:hypothetical protein